MNMLKQLGHWLTPETGHESVEAAHSGNLLASITGKQGLAADLEPEADTALIARTVRAAVEALPIADLVRASAMPMENWR